MTSSPALNEWLKAHTGPWALVECFDWWERGTMIAIPPLRDAILAAKIPLTYLPLNSLAVENLIARNSVDPDHVMRLSRTNQMVPVLVAIDERNRETVID